MLRATAIALVLAFTGCARTPAKHVHPEETTAEDPLQTHASPPFTPAEIHDAMPVGTHIRIRNTGPDGVTVTDWMVTRVDPDGADIRYTIEDDTGTIIKGPTEQRDSWHALRDHALFPAFGTRIDEDQVQVPAGTWPALRYTVNRERSGAQVTDTFWFAPELPGPPVQFVSRAGEEEVFRMELLLREHSPGTEQERVAHDDDPVP